MSVNMTPMIDVVFQLIVFFTTTSTMVKTEYTAAVELPEASEGVERQVRERKKVTANILPDGTIVVAGAQVTLGQFRRMLEADMAEYGPDRIEVLLRADRSARYGNVEPLLLLCARVGVWQVGFSIRHAKR